MPDITISVPAGQATRVLNGFAQAHGYEAQVTGEDGTLSPNPENKQEFMRRKIKGFVMDSVRSAEASAAAETARQAALDAVDAGIVLT
jgi:hypothetical protein